MSHHNCSGEQDAVCGVTVLASVACSVLICVMVVCLSRLLPDGNFDIGCQIASDFSTPVVVMIVWFLFVCLFVVVVVAFCFDLLVGLWLNISSTRLDLENQIR